MKRKLVILAMAAAMLLLGACASIISYTITDVAPADLSIATSVESCQSLLNRSNGVPVDQLTPGKIGLLNWNIKKGSLDGLRKDLRNISTGKELVILQEVDRGLGLKNQLNGISHESFSQGFSTKSRTTGVATYSTSKPVSECHLVSTEPLLRTPKATSITKYSLAQNDKTLLVVNVHAVNISFGLIRYREQMDQIRQIVATHNGPAILSGDFNTWRQKRMEIVSDMVSDLSFTPVTISTDHRTRFYGNALDHVFVRGLTVENSQTQQVTSSDHNPISVELRL